MKNLLPGLRTFSHDVFPNHKPLFESLSEGQNPHTLMITCSDSRVDPNFLTQSQPGELFVVRNAGNIIPPYGSSRGGEEAAIEYAIEGLSVSNIVVCGHSHCGAMSALMNNVDKEVLPCVHDWLTHARATKLRMRSEEEAVDPLRVVEENVLVQVNNLKTHPSVSAALQEGRVRIFGWVYRFEVGCVSVYNKPKGRFIPSVESKEEMEESPDHFAL